MGFEAEHYPGGIHLYAASMEDPTKFVPEFHVCFSSKLLWLDMTDELPKHPTTLLGTDQDLGTYNER